MTRERLVRSLPAVDRPGGLQTLPTQPPKVDSQVPEFGISTSPIDALVAIYGYYGQGEAIAGSQAASLMLQMNNAINRFPEQLGRLTTLRDTMLGTLEERKRAATSPAQSEARTRFASGTLELVEDLGARALLSDIATSRYIDNAVETGAYPSTLEGDVRVVLGEIGVEVDEQGTGLRTITTKDVLTAVLDGRISLTESAEYE